jgi:CRISPR-associated exonuclease Cas4
MTQTEEEPILFYENDVLLSATQLVEFWYCPRFTYFMHVLGIRQYEEKRLKVLMGRDIHEKKALQPEYLRKKIGVVKVDRNVYLSNRKLGICGILDEILLMEDNTLSVLDYKFAFNKHKFQTQFLQNVFYSIMLESNYHKKVNFCYIVYTRENNNLVKYDIKEKDKKEVIKTIHAVHRILSKGFYPESTKYKRRCPDCTYKNICIR